MSYYELSLQMHEKYRGKMEIKSKVPLNSKEDLATYYSPWVAQPCLEIAKDPNLAYKYTRKSNTIAVVSDGTAVLGLGNIWWLAGLPVMEGKCILFKEFGWVDAVPIVLNTTDPDEIIETIVRISPTFGGINLEDIKAPECFYIEEQLKKRLDIPVFHDDQHGTAIVLLAWLINSAKLINKTIENMKIVVFGAGAAGIATVNLFAKYGAKNIITFDSKWAISSKRSDLNFYKKNIIWLNIQDFDGQLEDGIIWADVFVGLSWQADILTTKHIQSMSDKPIIFATSNPNPEVNPELAKNAWAYIIATGRSDHPNQLNNVLVFPGIFRWALDHKISNITDEHKIKSAIALANYVKELSPENIIPNPLDKNISKIISNGFLI